MGNDYQQSGVRIPKNLHKTVKLLAFVEDRSLNAIFVDALRDYVKSRDDKTKALIQQLGLVKND